MSTPTSQVTGLVTGIDWESTIKQLMAIEKRRSAILEDRKSENETKLNLWAQIQSKVLALQSAAEGMDQRSEFAVKSASSSDTTIVAASADASAAVGAHTVEVLQLAKAHRIAAQGWADKNATGVGDSGGNLVIQVAGETITVADADLSADTTLEELRDLINSSPDNTGQVTASILDDGSGSNRYRLILSATDTGTDHAITVSSNPTTLDFSATRIDVAEYAQNWTGTSSVTASGTYAGTVNKTFTFTVAGSGTQTVGAADITLNWVDSLGNSGSLVVPNGYAGGNIAVAEGVTTSFAAGTLVAGQSFSVDVFNPQLAAAQDATIRVDGIYMNKSSNKVTDVLEGVTLDLLSAEQNTQVDVVIGNDTAAVRKKIQSLVDVYNSMASDISMLSSYDEKNQSAAPLLGDGFLSSIRSRMSAVTSQAVAGLAGNVRYNSLAVIGIKASTGGLLTIDSDKFDSALTDHFSDVVDLFTQSFSSADSKISFVSAGDATKGGSYSLSIQYDGQGNPTAATINGQTAVVDGTLIRGAEGTSVEGLVLNFTRPGTGPGTLNSTIRFGKGIAAMMGSEASGVTDADRGPIHFAEDNINRNIESLDKQIESWNERLALIEQRLRRQFTNLETAISKMKNQSSYLAGVLG